MPKVGGKPFPYSPAGIAAAEQEAMKTGKTLHKAKTKKKLPPKK